MSNWGSEFEGRSTVVICENGQGLSEGVAAWLRHAGASPAEVLAGGHFAWMQAGLPLVPESKLPPRDSHGRTVWVTRSRPKIDRIACPWLIRRFVDPAAVFLFVSPAEVQSVAERFKGRPSTSKGFFGATAATAARSIRCSKNWGFKPNRWRNSRQWSEARIPRASISPRRPPG